MDLASYYDSYWLSQGDLVDYQRLDLIARYLEPGEKVLEVDCGPGMLASRLREKGAVVCATDLSRVAAERARQRGVPVSIVDVDAGDLPFATGTFDAVVSDSAVEHRFYSWRAIQECTRVIRPGGKLIICLPNIAHWRYRVWLLAGRFPYIANSPTDELHLRFFTVHDCKKLFTSLGLRVVDVDGSASLWVQDFYPPLLRRGGLAKLYTWLARKAPSLLARDIIMLCRKED
ncbi:MAG: class I SAM-dependent methyltransferase [Chloroflexi bacterium]|nr:class I SAM-dependent methyltransferase [Chloroflexota bacterium]